MKPLPDSRIAHWLIITLVALVFGYIVASASRVDFGVLTAALIMLMAWPHGLDR